MVLVASSCGHSIEASRSLKEGEFLDKLIVLLATQDALPQGVTWLILEPIRIYLTPLVGIIFVSKAINHKTN
jgi:hypothetical protein